jgi:hypothetical protein
LAREFDNFCRQRQWPSPGQPNIEKQIYRLESGRSRSPDDFYTRLYCEFFKKSSQELFGDTNAPPCSDDCCELTSHKFVPAFVGPEGAELLRVKLEMTASDGQLLDCYEIAVPHPDGECTLYVFPFGVALFHLVERIRIESVAELAVWRRRTYRECRSWAADRLGEILGGDSHPSYVLSLYLVHSPCWPETRLEAALRLMCVPRVLLDREAADTPESRARAELVEQSLLRDGFDHHEVVDFGMRGISKGVASWSGVVYYPIAENRALRDSDLIRCEVAVQAIWAYCDHIREQVEGGDDPVVASEFGWRFLRGVRSRLTTERPQETSQHRCMREAIVETSGLTRHLTHAVEHLRESNERSGA